MYFERRELKEYAEPVVPSQLVVGATYFAVQFLDPEMLIPQLEAVVFLGKNLIPDDRGILYFQDAESYRQGTRLESTDGENADVYRQSEDQVNHIFEFEFALDVLLSCALRRQRGHPPG
jgi:hypothetical protein